jgi:ADP-sugar diphosphatase
MATKFFLPKAGGDPAVEVSLPAGITQEQFVGWKPFANWLTTFRKSMDLQTDSEHPFYDRKERYSLKQIDVMAVDWWGSRIGFLMMKTLVSNDQDAQPLAGTVFLRGGSVAILMILRPEGDDVNDERWVVMTQQPRVPAGSLTFYEIPAGMIDDAGTFSGAAANELRQETNLTVPRSELKDMTKLALKHAKASEGHLQKAMYPSPGGCDEFIALFLWERTMPRIEINELRDKLAGVDREKIRVKLVRYEELWREGARDGKLLPLSLNPAESLTLSQGRHCRLGH